ASKPAVRRVPSAAAPSPSRRLSMRGQPAIATAAREAGKGTRGRPEDARLRSPNARCPLRTAPQRGGVCPAMVYSGTDSDAGVQAPRSPNAAEAKRVAGALGRVAAQPAEPSSLAGFLFSRARTRERGPDGPSPNSPWLHAGRGR